MSLLRKAKKLIKKIPGIGKPINQRIDNVITKAWHVPGTSKFINRTVINDLATLTAPRPRAFSLWHHQPQPPNTTTTGPVSNYTSWYSLIDRKFYSRHLPPSKDTTGLPNLVDLLALFKRPADTPMKTDRNSLLFMFYAQWLTDSVLRTDMSDRRKNTSNHEIDLCQIYGLTDDVTQALRQPNSPKLKARVVKGEEYPDLLYTTDEHGNLVVKKDYAKFNDFIATQDKFLNQIPGGITRKKDLYFTGLDNGNSSIGYTVFTTLFLRQHNKICNELIDTYKDDKEWNPGPADYFNERVFQTARLINIAILLKLTLEEYINHISGRSNFTLDHTFAEKQVWYRPNWIAVEFNLLYRWHSMVPDHITVGQAYNTDLYRFNNALFEQHGLNKVSSALSSQPAGKIGLLNTPEFLWQAEQFSLIMARDFKLRSYNEYRDQFQLDRLADFSELTSDTTLAAHLSELYDHDINKLEFLTGLFAQEPTDGKLFGDLLVRMISYDALTQIFTNPLLSKNIFTTDTLSSKGMEIIDSINSFQDLAEKNSAGENVIATFFVSNAPANPPPSPSPQQHIAKNPLQPRTPEKAPALTENGQ